MLMLVALLVLQDPAEEAVSLAREIRRQLAAGADSEVRLRLDASLRWMSGRASAVLFGEPEDPAQPVLRFHDVRNLVTRPRDRWSSDFLAWVRGPLAGATDGIEERPAGPVDEETLFGLVRERTGPAHWEEKASLTWAPNRQMLVSAPPGLQGKVTQTVRQLEKELLIDFRVSVALFASAKPLDVARDVDGSMTGAAWETLVRRADEGTEVRRLSSIELAAQADQTVSTFSGSRRPADGLANPTVPEGLALQLRLLPAGEGAALDLRLSWTKVLSIDDAGALRLPKVAEAAMSDRRSVPLGVPVVLGSPGMLAPETALPPHLTVIVRVTRVNP